MSFQRYDDVAGNTKQKKIDKLLKKCPFCGEDPHWLLKLEYGNSTLTCKCEKCDGELYAENYNLNSQSTMIAVYIGKYNYNNLEQNACYHIVYLATLSNVTKKDNTQNSEEDKELSVLKKHIVALRQQGMSMAQIQNALNLPSMYLNAIVAKMRRNGEWPKRKVGREKVAEAMEIGETDPYKLAEVLGYTIGTIRHYKSANEKTGRPKRNYKHCDRTNAINEDLKAGVLTTAEIARKHGVKWQSVHKLRKKLEEDLNDLT